MIKIFRLSSGIEVITEILSNGDWDFPMIIVAAPAKDGQASVTLTPLLFFAKGTSGKPNLDNVFLEYDPVENIEKMYEQTVNAFRMKKSGLVAPSQSDISRASAGAARN